MHNRQSPLLSSEHDPYVRGGTHYNELMAGDDEKAVKASGLPLSENKESVVKEGDIMLFRFDM